MAPGVVNEALQSASYSTIGGKRYWGNRDGLNTMRSLDSTGRDLANVRRDYETASKDLRDQKSQAGNLAKKSGDHLARAEQAETSQAEYFKYRYCGKKYSIIRGRRFETILRDGNRRRKPDQERISEGNIAAHGGDAVADAFLYTLDIRRDEDFLEELYGLKANEIMKLCKSHSSSRRLYSILNQKFLNPGDNDCLTTIKALNEYSSIFTEQPGNIPSEETTQTFHNFIAALRKDLLADPRADKTELSNAYWKFQKIK